MTSTTDNQQTVFYTLVAVLTTVALILVMCKQSGSAAAISSISILAIVVMLTVQSQKQQAAGVVVSSNSSTAKNASNTELPEQDESEKTQTESEQTQAQSEQTQTQSEVVQGEQAAGEATMETEGQVQGVASSVARGRRPKKQKQKQAKKKDTARYTANQIANVPGNEYVGMAEAPRKFYHQEPPRMVQECSSAKLVLPITMEGELPYGRRPEDYGGDNLTSCNGGIKTVPPLPPMPGLALPPPTGESIWRLPENVVDQCSREESIAAVVSGLPECCQQTPMQAIRNQGLYGVKGNLSCDKLKRSAVADYNLLEPLGARNAFLAYNSYDQLHAKDQFMIPINKEQPE